MKTHTPPSTLPIDLSKLPVKRRIQIFKAGKHTDANGVQVEFTTNDIDDLVNSYNATTCHFAPLVIGHPKVDDPALGGVMALARDGEKLFADCIMTQDVADAIDGFKWLGRSVAIYGPNFPANPTKGKPYVRHIGLTNFPAVKGMELLTEFSEPGCYVFEEIAGWMIASPLETIARMLRRLREKTIEKEGLDEADNVLPDWSISALEDAARQLYATTQDDAPQPTTQFNEGKTMTPEEELAALRAKTAQLEAANAALLATQAQEKKAARHAGHLAFCERLVADKKMQPSMVAVAVKNLDFLAQQDPTSDTQWKAGQVHFSEAGSAGSEYAGFIRDLGAQPVNESLFAEVANQGRAAKPPTGENPLVANAAARAAATK